MYTLLSLGSNNIYASRISFASPQKLFVKISGLPCKHRIGVQHEELVVMVFAGGPYLEFCDSFKSNIE
jgi:hypothetical protein